MSSSNRGTAGALAGGAAGMYFGVDPGWMAALTGGGQTLGDIAGGAGFKPERTMLAGAAGYGAGKGYEYGKETGWWGGSPVARGAGMAMAPSGDYSYANSPEAMKAAGYSPGEINAYGAGGGVAKTGGGGMFSGGNILPYTLTGGAMSYLGAEQQNRMAQEQQDRNIGLWRENAFPNDALVNANMATANSNAATQYETASRQLDSTLAARGISPGSPMYQAARTQLLRGKQRDMSTMATDLIKFKNTPTQGVPFQNYMPVSPFAETAKIPSSMAGLMVGSELYRGMRG